MKNFMVLFMILLFISVGCNVSSDVQFDLDSIETYRDIPGVTQAEISAIEALKDEYGSFSYGCMLENELFELPDGTHAGFSGDFYALLTSLFEVDFVHVYFEEWDDLKKGLSSDDIGFVGISTPTPNHHGKYVMSEIIAGRGISVYTLTSSGNMKEEFELTNRKVVFLSDAVEYYLITEQYPHVSFEAVEANSISEAIEMLLSGEVEAFVVDSAALMLDSYDFLQSRNILPLLYLPIALTATNSKFEPIIKVFDKYLQVGGKEKLLELYRKGKLDYNKYKLFGEFTEEEKSYIFDKIEKNKKIDIGLQHDAYPVSFYNKNDEEFQGVAIDILSEITMLIEIEFTHITTSTDTPISTILEKLKSGEISMMTQLLYAESRKGSYLWSNAYLETNYALLSKIDYPDLEIYQVSSKRVGTIDQTAHEEMFEKWFPNHKHQIKYPTTVDAFIALENDEIDLLMLSENMLLTQTNYHEKPDFKINIDFYIPIESYYGFSKNEEVLRSIVNKSMRYVEIEDIGSKWSNLSFDYTKKINEVRTLYMTIFSSIMLLILISMAFLLLTNKNLSKNLAERTTMLSTILSSIPDTIFCKNIDGKYTICNPSFEKQAGVTEAELVGKTYSEVFKDRVIDAGCVQYEIDQKVFTNGTTEIIEEMVLFPDGSQRLLETLKAPLMQNNKIIGLLGIGRDVTERKEISTRIERIINAAQIVFLMTIDGKVIETNEYSKTHIGVKIGDDINEFYAAPGQRNEILEMAKQHGTVSNIVVKYKISNGEIHRFLSSFTLVMYEQKSACILWGIDIERDKRLNDQLRAAQQSLQTIMDTLPLPVGIIDDETHNVVYSNSMFNEMMDFKSSEEVLKLKSTDLFIEVQDDGTSVEILDKYLAAKSKPIIKEVKLLSAKNETVYVRAHTAPIDYYGKKSVIGFFTDLTQEKETRKILINIAEREKEANQTKSLFLANMSHEIRTPMNGIIGMTDLLLAENLVGRQLQYVKDIRMSAESLLCIINDILDLSKISEGKLQITPTDIDLSMLLENTISMIRFVAQSKGLDLLCDIQIKTPEYVYIDDIRLNQVLINLLSNAVKFTKNGYVKLSVKIENDNICFEINDTGIGIQKDDLPLIFEVFGQFDRRKNRAIKGTGLGLSISKSLIELMGGDIKVESEYNKGTNFYVTVPYSPGVESAVEKTDVEFKYISAPTAHILLVDDIQTNLTVGSGLLRLCNITADVAISGIEAIELVKEKDYDIVFMDHMMPGMDGIEAMRVIRKLGAKYQDIPIIALTANAVNESKNLLLESGMNDFLSKPIDKSALIHILNKWLPKRKIEEGFSSHSYIGNIPYSDILAQASKIDNLNIELALSRIGGMQDVLESSIKQVAFSMSKHIKEMDIFLSDANLREFSIKAHGLKGALANIGATTYSELAAELEIASKADNITLCLNKFSAFVDTVIGFADELKMIFPRQDTISKLDGDLEFLKFKITEALKFLKSYEDSDTLDCLFELVNYTFGEKTDELLNNAIRELEAFDYEKTTLLLEEIQRILVPFEAH